LVAVDENHRKGHGECSLKVIDGDHLQAEVKIGKVEFNNDQIQIY
jgi:hypothetical protein